MRYIPITRDNYQDIGKLFRIEFLDEQNVERCIYIVEELTVRLFDTNEGDKHSQKSDDGSKQ